MSENKQVIIMNEQCTKCKQWFAQVDISENQDYCITYIKPRSKDRIVLCVECNHKIDAIVDKWLKGENDG